LRVADRGVLAFSGWNDRRSLERGFVDRRFFGMDRSNLDSMVFVCLDTDRYSCPGGHGCIFLLLERSGSRVIVEKVGWFRNSRRYEYSGM
jgi:hypothetical protein